MPNFSTDKFSWEGFGWWLGLLIIGLLCEWWVFCAVMCFFSGGMLTFGFIFITIHDYKEQFKEKESDLGTLATWMFRHLIKWFKQFIIAAVSLYLGFMFI